MINANSIVRFLVGGMFLTALWGCGSANSEAPAFLGAHPAGWEAKSAHGAAYKANPAQCRECHGSELKGGSSKISCDACHPGYPHLEGWQEPLQHGYAYGANPQSCQLCHGPNYLGGTSQVSCINNPTGTQPTGCHPNPSAIHTAGWTVTLHGKTAKLAPSTTDPLASFLACRNCHGYGFTGTPLSNNKGCYSANCHPDGRPHSAWNGTSSIIVFSHADSTVSPATATENAPVCYGCHNRVQSHTWFNADGSPRVPPIGNLLTPSTGNPDQNAQPGCYNNTMCHGQ